MIVGSGLLARAFAADWAHREDACIFASGVADATCVDPKQFARERTLLEAALHSQRDADAFVYFGTCSANGGSARRLSPYVRHKLAMERLVSTHRRALVLRLPHVAGAGRNPYTLLNFLHARIVRGEAFELWANARRSVIDVRDVVRLAAAIVDAAGMRGRVLDVATPIRHRVEEIVAAIEAATGCRAHYRRIERGEDEPTDLGPMLSVIGADSVRFDDDYLRRTVARYHSTTMNPPPAIGTSP